MSKRVFSELTPSEIEKRHALVNKNGGVFEAKEFESIIDSSDLSFGSKVGYYNTIKNIIKMDDPDDIESLDRITKKIRTNKSELVKIEKDNKLTKKESLRWMNWDTIKEMYLDMKSKMDSGVYKKIKEIERFLIFALYMEIEPLRLDFGNTIIEYNLRDVGCFKIDSPNILDIRIDNEHVINYDVFKIDINPENVKEVRFQLLHDKVSNKMGNACIDIPQVLFKYICILLNARKSKISSMLKFHPSVRCNAYLFSSPKNAYLPIDHNHQLHKPNMKRLIASIPKLDGSKSNLCVDTIRSARVTELFSKPSSMNEKERVAKLMRTSINQMLQSYNKIL